MGHPVYLAQNKKCVPYFSKYYMFVEDPIGYTNYVFSLLWSFLSLIQLSKTTRYKQIIPELVRAVKQPFENTDYFEHVESRPGRFISQHPVYSKRKKWRKFIDRNKK